MRFFVLLMAYIFSVTTLLLFTSTTASAYIPPGDYLLEKVAKAHGKGVYAIEQELTFRNEGETLQLRERWMVKDGETMSLRVRGSTVSLDFVFAGGKVYFDENGRVNSRKLSLQSLERYYHARGDRTLSDLLVAARVVHPRSVQSKPRPKTLAQIKVDIDPYMRLMRLADEAAILISYSSSSQEPNAPGIWIDQDDYTIRKIKFVTQDEVVASQFQTFAHDLHFPRNRTVSWGQHTVDMRLLKLNPVSKSSKLDAEFSPGSVAKQPLNWGTSALKEQIQEFYLRFR